MVTYTELSSYLNTRYGLCVVRCMQCYTVYCGAEQIDIIGLDKHLHCCSSPFVLFVTPEQSPRASGVYNLNSKLLILGIEFL